ncbi:MAG: hypothetical protein FWG12_08040 [Holophagaceae bacterium]|nr:hypothetical protein [Holophagaceae bacterium]
MKFTVGMENFDDWFHRMEARYKELADKYKIIEETENKARREKLKQIRNEMPKANIVIGKLPPHIQKALGTQADSLLFSPDGLAKQLCEHPELSMAEYRSVFEQINGCQKIYPDKKLHVALILPKDKSTTYRVVLKTTGRRSEVYLLSLHKMSGDPLDRFMKRLKNKGLL